jgi:hypothetical protein
VVEEPTLEPGSALRELIAAPVRRDSLDAG